MANMQASRNIWGRSGNDEDTLRLDLAVRRKLRLEKSFLLPPIVPGGFDRDWVIASGHGFREI